MTVQYKIVKLTLSLVLLSGFSFGQSHWESIQYANDEWRYFLQDSAPSTNWYEASYNDSLWAIAKGSFGYGDNDDTTLLTVEYSLYIRTVFQVSSTTLIDTLLLDIDYDDGFVAYLNGIPIGRSENVDTDYPEFDYEPLVDVEATMYSGGQPKRIGVSPALLVEGTNTLAIQGINKSPSSSDFSLAPFLHAQIAGNEIIYKSVPDWFQYPDEVFTSNLPLILINTNGQYIPDEPKITAHMGIINNDSVNKFTDSFNNYNGYIGIEIRGQSSQNFDKKGYAIETRFEDGSNNNVSLLGLPEENDWVLHGPYSDKSLIRNTLAYMFFQKTGQYAPRIKLCEVFLNNEYNGVYILTEKIKRDNNRVDISKLNSNENSGEDLTGGYILRIDKGYDPGWYSPYKSNNNMSIYIQYYYPEPDSITFEQKNYIEGYFTEFETVLYNDDFSTGNATYSSYINDQSFVDFFLINELARNVDGFRLSSYFYKEKDKDGVPGSIVMGPIWDFNLGFGNVNYDAAESPQGWLYKQNFGPPHHQQDHPFWWRKLMSDPVFNNKVFTSWNKYRSTFLSDNNITIIIDSLASLLQEPQARNFEKFNVLGNYVWPNNFVGDTYEEEIDFLKNWLLDRAFWMDQNLEYIEVGVADLSAEIALQMYPNPFDDELSISFYLDKPEPLYLTMYDLLGNVLYAQKVNTIYGSNGIQLNQDQINFHLLKSGTYILQLRFENGKYVNQIIVKH